MFGAKVRNIVYHCLPQFYYIKMGYEGCTFHGRVILMYVVCKCLVPKTIGPAFIHVRTSGAKMTSLIMTSTDESINTFTDEQRFFTRDHTESNLNSQIIKKMFHNL